jgi:predicted nucleotidyltransferase
VEAMSANTTQEVETRLGVSLDRLAAFCRSHDIQQCDLFGSVLTEQFGPGSDVDVLVTFSKGRTPSLFGHMRLESGLSDLIGRPVDLITMAALKASENDLLQDEILASRRTVYAEQAG